MKQELKKVSALADWGAQHMISVKKLRFSCRSGTKVRCQEPLVVAKVQPCPGIKQTS